MRYAPHVALYAGIALIVHSLFACSGVQRIDVRNKPVFALKELQRPAAEPRIRAALRNGGFVVRVRRGEHLPVRMTSRLGVAHLQAGVNRLVFDRDVYVYIAGRRAMVSPDGQRWARLGDWRTTKRLFGLRRGTFQVGFGVSKKDGALVTLGLDAKP